jgi:hypothetical protein
MPMWRTARPTIKRRAARNCRDQRALAVAGGKNWKCVIQSIHKQLAQVLHLSTQQHTT